MGVYSQIEQKLRQFSKKYYYNELIKGSILFLSLGCLYLLFTLFVEHFLWLDTSYRTLLFWVFIGIETILFFRFICFPIFKLLGIQKGISFEEASKIIGAHFPEVQDKLINILQLKDQAKDSELILASIEQKSQMLQPIPFINAINFTTNVKYLKYALIPLIIWGIIALTGNNGILSQSLDRVVHHRTAYSPPAPFAFFIKNNDLRVIQGKSFELQVAIQGKVIPEEAKIYFNDEVYYLQPNGAGLFSYTFSEINTPTSFYIKANEITSTPYRIEVIHTPNILKTEMALNYPSYLRKPKETIANTGNLAVPEGTTIAWNVFAKQTDSITFTTAQQQDYFTTEDTRNFKYQKRILRNLDYTITTSNRQLKNYERLDFSITVVKDEYPKIQVKSDIDSIRRGNAQFAGQLSDDYGIKKLQLVYYDKEQPEAKKIVPIKVTKENLQSFYFQFPNELTLQEGINYELFFEVYDNDGVNGAKRTQSTTFLYRQKTKEEVEQELLNEQKDYIHTLENSLQQQQRNKKDLEKIQKTLKNKKNVNWNDRKNIQNFIKRQEQYKDMMQRQTKKLQENFSEKKEISETLQQKKENLQKRIAELKKLEKQEQLLKELKKYADKLNKNDLLKKAKQLTEQSKQQEKSLERILELTKRFYVEQKATQLAHKLEQLAKKQDSLQQKEAPIQEQKSINDKFKKIQDELKELQKDNKALKKPMEIPKMEELQKETKNELNKAQQSLEQKQSNKAKQHQKKAGKKLQKMSKQMQKSMSAMNSEMQQENMESLRQILENLVIFSFQQEDLMKLFEKSRAGHPDFGKHLKKQNQLKTYFEHIDDSLYVLSLRVPQISTKIQDELSSAHYNLDQSLENFAENRFSTGISNQRYIMTASNALADLLSDVLDNMKNAQQSMSGKGKGGKSFSLPDLIQKQQGLTEKMKQGMQKKGQQGKPKDGKNGKPQQQKNGKQQGGEGDDLDGELYQIYKEQSQLREQLNNAIQKGQKGSGAAKKVVKKMEQLENEILEKGFTQGTLERMRKLNYELLKLDKATFEQGKDKQRKSNTNALRYRQQKLKELQFKKLFFNQTEILNRQSLPLQQNYKRKVQEYFKQN